MKKSGAGWLIAVKQLFFLMLIFTTLGVCSNEVNNEMDNEVKIVGIDLRDQKVLAGVKVTGRVEIKGGKYWFALKVSNNTDDPIEVPRLGLHRLNIAWVLMETQGTGRILEELAFPDTPSPGSWVVEPKGFIEEKLGLDSHYPQLRDVLKRNSVILYWSLQYNPFDPAVARQGGFVELQQMLEGETK